MLDGPSRARRLRAVACRRRHAAAMDAHPLDRLDQRLGRLFGEARARCHAGFDAAIALAIGERSEEHTSELQSLMRISYAVFCLKKKKQTHNKCAKTHHI